MPANITQIARTPGGTPVLGCACLVAWWPVVNQLARARGFVRETLDVSQGSYRAGATSASAGTHDGGGVLDLNQHSDELSLFLRQCGAAAWERDSGSFANNRHTHLVLVDCPHLAAGAASQVDEWRAGGDGLVGSAPDPDPRPASIRTWSQGLTWAKSQLAKESDMTIQEMKTALKDDDEFRALLSSAVVNGGSFGDVDGNGKGDTPINILKLSHAILVRIARKVGA